MKVINFLLVVMWWSQNIQAARLTNFGIMTHGSSNRNNDQSLSDCSLVASTRANLVDSVKLGFEKNFALLQRGSEVLVSNFKKAQKLKKLRKTQGDKALSFSDYKFLEQSKEDMGKSFRLLVTFPFSPEFFFYSYIVFPMMSTDNPWAWKALPSSYDHEGDTIRRSNTLAKRRIQALMVSMQSLQNDVVDDIAEAIRGKRSDQIRIIESALQQKSLVEAMNILTPWTMSKKEKPSKKPKPQQVTFANIPGAVVKECCKAVGVDGVPNLPLVNRLNRGSVNQYMDKVKASDDFLVLKGGVDSLSDSEVEVACFERCIPVEVKGSGSGTVRPTKVLRKDLGQWLSIVTERPMQMTVSSGKNGKAREVVATNYQNKRLAMMALNVAKDLKTADYSSVYRTLVCK